MSLGLALPKLVDTLNLPLWVLRIVAIVITVFLIWKFIYHLIAGPGFSRQTLIETLEVLQLQARIKEEYS